MAGRISEADRERVREACRIDQVVSEYVTLRRAGADTLKGLCPFHDEKTPSFQVSVNRGGGRYHCFGCGQGGDVFEFVMAMEHLSFVEAVQRLAERAGVTLSLVEGGASVRQEAGTKARLLAANKAAAEFFTAQLATPEAEAARRYLAERGFDEDAIALFGCGYAPGGWDSMVKALIAKGFTVDELSKAGLAKQGQRGWIDQFHRRLLWPIRDPSGDVVGFGARRLFEDDRLQAKYVNTSETMLYRKSQLLFGLDLAKREIARERQVVVVEGYTDVMAMHLAGVTTAVASCGTAFGEEHISVLRRYLMDSDLVPGNVIYTFDGDAAGQKAALKAFESDQRFAANTYVSVAPDGLDPCELRQARGDAAVRELVAARKPLFEFAITESLRRFDLDTVEGQMAATTAMVPLVARIKRPEQQRRYAQRLAGWLGSDPGEIMSLVRRHAAAADRASGSRAQAPAAADQAPAEVAVMPRPNPGDRRLSAQRETLKLVLQQPQLLAGGYQLIDIDCFTEPAYRAVHEAVTAAGGPASARDGSWVDEIAARLPIGAPKTLVTELAVEPVAQRAEPDARYAGSILAAVQVPVARERERRTRSELQRAESGGDSSRAHELRLDLLEISEWVRALVDRAAGRGE